MTLDVETLKQTVEAFNKLGTLEGHTFQELIIPIVDRLLNCNDHEKIEFFTWLRGTDYLTINGEHIQNWQLFKDISDLSEEEAKEIIERSKHLPYHKYGLYTYTKEEDYKQNE